jgi:uncharacterized protein (TIGR03435 family)
MRIFTHYRSALAVTLLSGVVAAQTSAQSFEVASVKPNKSGDPVARANFPLGPGSVFTPTGGLFSATNYPLATYIAFAYRVQGNQEQSLRSQLPDWALTEHFDIQARAEGNPTKDQMRLMMRSLLADRFKLAIHVETRQVSVFALVPVRPGKTAPRFQPHTDDSSCSAVPPPREGQVAGQFPALCGGLLPMTPSAPGLQRFGARNVSMGFLANQLTAMGRLDRPVLDRTGLSGNFDFALEWAPEPNPLQPPGADLQPDLRGPIFQDAVREQLGFKLESQKGAEDVLVVEHVERPSEN